MSADLTVSSVQNTNAAKQAALVDRPANVRKTADAAQKFESFVLQSFVQEMMPETQESVFGGGISGDFWKSMMAEKIAEQVAARGGVGIAETLRNGHSIPTRPTGINPLDVLQHAVSADGADQLNKLNPVGGK